MNIFVDVSNIKIFQMELLENFMIENNIEYEKIYTINSIDDRDKEIERLNNIIKEVRNMLYKRDLDNYDTYTANIVLDIQSDFEEILRGEY